MYFTMSGTEAGEYAPKLSIEFSAYVLYIFQNKRLFDQYHRYINYVFGAVNHAGRYHLDGVPSEIVCFMHESD